jgi:hypothetical protein
MVHFYPTAMRIAVEARIPDMLIGKPHGLSVDELAQKSQLRIVAARHESSNGGEILIYFIIYFLRSRFGLSLIMYC